MMAPLAMAQNFVGDYYAGPSGAAIGALQLGSQLGEAFRDMGAASRDRQLYADKQAEVERGRMQDVNDRYAVAKALNPQMEMNSSNGMSNRDMTRKMQLPSADTQVAVYGLQQKKADAAKEEQLKGLQSLASYWYANGGPQSDPTGEKFQMKTGRNPFELIPQGVITSMESIRSREDMAADQRENARILAGMRESGGGGSDSYRFMPMVGADGATKIMAINPKDPYAAPIEVGRPPQKAGDGSNGLLPLDTAGRKSLAEWVASTTDAQRVAATMDEAMGATVDPQTGETKYKPQPSGPLSGGTGMLLGALPDKVAARVDPEGVSVRSAIANFSSQIMNALSGAAVSEQEKKRLEAFLPTSSDDWQTLRQKMTDYKGFLRSKGTAFSATYGDNEVLNRGMSMLGGNDSTRQQSGARQKVGPRPGTVIDGYEYLGGDPNNSGSWRQANGK